MHTLFPTGAHYWILWVVTPTDMRSATRPVTQHSSLEPQQSAGQWKLFANDNEVKAHKNLKCPILISLFQIVLDQYIYGNEQKFRLIGKSAKVYKNCFKTLLCKIPNKDAKFTNSFSEKEVQQDDVWDNLSRRSKYNFLPLCFCRYICYLIMFSSTSPSFFDLYLFHLYMRKS